MRLECEWIPTAAITEASAGDLLGNATAIWCTPGSPYASTAGALLAIRHARIEQKPFLGTCGGFQHALMEFASNVLHRTADHQEMTPDAESPLIVKLSCALVGVKGKVVATPGSQFAKLLGGPSSIEEFNCSYGVNGDLTGVFSGSDLEFVAWDEERQIRAFQLRGHPFFYGTLFQPERRALADTIHPLVHAFFGMAAR